MGKRRSRNRVEAGGGGAVALASTPKPQADESGLVISLGTPSVRSLSLGAGAVALAAILTVGGLNLILQTPAKILADGNVYNAAYLVVLALVLSTSVWHLYRNHHVMSGMIGMMVGMTLGMMAGLMVGTVMGITNGMTIGTTAGMVAGIGIGVVCGRLEGLMGILEGLMAGVMGGMMGAMLGVMVRYDSLLFPFLGFLSVCFVVCMGGLMVMVNREVKSLAPCPDCPPGTRTPKDQPTPTRRPGLAALATGLSTLSLLLIMAFGPRAAYLNISGSGIAEAASAAPAQSTPSATLSASLGPDDAAAIVNDQPIKMAELTRQVNLNLAFLKLNGTPEDALKSQIDQMRAGLIQQIAEQRLIWQEAQKASIVVADAEIDAYVTGLAEKVKLTQEQLGAELAKNNTSLADLRGVVQVFLMNDKFIREKVLQGVAANQQGITFNQWYGALKARSKISYNIQPASATTGRTGSGQGRAEQKGNVQEVNMTASAAGYSPNVISVKQGVPLRINITTDGSAGCARQIVFPTQNIYKLLPVKGTTTVEFTPNKSGQLSFSCAMGMFGGMLLVE